MLRLTMLRVLVGLARYVEVLHFRESVSQVLVVQPTYDVCVVEHLESR
jgi:hypothetical protein